MGLKLKMSGRKVCFETNMVGFFLDWIALWLDSDPGMIEDRFTNSDGEAWRLRNRCTVLCFAPTIMLEGHLLAFDIAHDLPPPFVRFSRGRGRRKPQHFDQSHENKEKERYA